MSQEQWWVQSGTDAAHWPRFPVVERVDETGGPHALRTTTADSHDGNTAAAWEDYAHQWMADVPPSLTEVTDTETGREGAEEKSGGAGCASTRAPLVSAVAMLNALLVGVPPPQFPSAEAPPRQPGGVWMDAPLPILAALQTAENTEQDSGDDARVFSAATLLLRHSKWLAAGVAHAAGAVSQRLPSAQLLSYAYHHALDRIGGERQDTGVSAAPPVPADATESGDVSPTSSASFSSATSPTTYRGSLVLLLLHPIPFLRIWARDALLRQLAAPPPPPTASFANATAAAAASAHLSSLLRFALQLLCTLKHTAALFESLAFTETRTATASVGVVVAQAKVEAAVEGLLHVLTVLAAWETRYAAAMEARAAAAPPLPQPLLSALARCRATAVLLGGSLLVHSLQAVHNGVATAVLTSSRQLRPATSSSTGASADPARAAAVALRHVLQPLNNGLSANPRMPKAVAVSALTLKKTLVKVLVHCLLDAASGLAESREEEAWRRSRLQWLWGVAALLEPPTTRVAAPLLPPSERSAAGEGGDGSSAAAASVPVPAKTAGWLLKPLLKNAEQQFQWASAMDTARSKPASTAQGTATALLERAVYGLHLLLDTLCAALPSLLPTRYAHDVLASYESQLLTLAIGGIVHTRSAHALRLHRLLFTVDVGAFAAGAGAATPAQTGSAQSSASPLFSAPAVCLQRVWLTLPTLLTQVCKMPPGATESHNNNNINNNNNASGSLARLPVSHVLAFLCGALSTLTAPAAAAPCAQWLLLSPATAMGDAPPPFQWVVQRCLRTLTETLRDHHDVLLRAWLGTSGTASGHSAMMAAASFMLTEAKDLLRLVHVLPFAAAEDGGLRRLAEHLASLFSTGLTPAVTRSMTSDAAESVWGEVVLTQPALAAVTPQPSRPSFSVLWDVASPAVANTARAQGRHWLHLLRHCVWQQKTDAAVRCGWWAATLLADVVALDADQRRALAEDVILALPTAPMRSAAATTSRSSASGGASVSQPPSNGGGAEDAADPWSTAPRSPEYAQEVAQQREEAGRLCTVAQHLFLAVLRKADVYPRNTLDGLLRHISDAIPPSRVRSDTPFHRAVQPLLVRLCPRRPDVQASLSVGAAPWLQHWVAAAAQSLTLSLAEQERRFAQFEMEEDALRKEQSDAARTAGMEAQLRRSNAAARAAELDAARRARGEAAGDNPPTPHPTAPTATAAVNVVAPAQAPQQTSLMQFPDRPLSPQLALQQHRQLQQHSKGGVKRPRSASPPASNVAVVNCTVSDSDSDVEAVAVAAPQPPAPAAPSPPPPPSRLQQKLQAQNARNTHRVHHAEQLRRLQERLCRVAASTNLVRLQPPLINDIIGAGSHCMAPAVPVLPDVFVSAAEAAAALQVETAMSAAAVSMPFGDAANVYGERFAPHIALELRYDIVRNYEDLIEGMARGSPPQHHHLLHHQRHTQRQQQQQQQQSMHDELTTSAAAAPLSWTRLLPLHPSIAPTCFAVHNVGVAPATKSGNAHDPLSFHFSIRAALNPAVAAQRGGRAMEEADKGQPQPQPGQRAVDPAVRCVAEQGLSAGLAEGDVVAVLLPLHALGAAWVERQIGCALNSLPPAEQAARVKDVIAALPPTWRTLGCVSQVCVVQALHPGERTAVLGGFPPTEAPSGHHHHHTNRTHAAAATAATAAPPLRFQHALHMAYQTAHNIFYVRKLTSLNSFQTELAALHRIDHTRFAATLYDPCHAAPVNAAYYEWVTRLLSVPGTSQQQQQQQPLLTQLRRRLLLQQHLNDWQIRAIVAVLYASCLDWDEGEVRKQLGALPPRAPEVLMIEGPPGTGKTQTIGSLTLNVLHHLSRTRGANARVLVCAPSNCAVDEALLRVVHLRQQLILSTQLGDSGSALPSASTADASPRPTYNVLSSNILRIGIKDRVDPEVLRLPQPVFFDDVVEQRMSEAGPQRAGTGTNYRNASASAAAMSARNAARASVLESASIVFSTLGSLHHIGRQVQGFTFDVVIVDEASQGTEPAVLQALALARHKCVLVGDSKQLQPTILSPEASRCGLRRSLLVRLLACGHKSFLLRTQYRMHPDICAFPNAYFYASKLETDRSVRLRSRMSSRTSGLLSDTTTATAAAAASDPATQTVAQRLGRCPRFVFVDVPQAVMERRRGKSLLNRAEAVAVVQVMRQLRTLLRLSVKDMAPQLGIITFYNAQKEVILSMLTPEERRSGLQVASVDSFQGKEKRIILLSCVRTVQRGQLCSPGTAAAPALVTGGKAEVPGAKRVRSQHHQHNAHNSESNDAVTAAPTMEERGENRQVGRFGLGFLADGHRLNVALTRAQDLCVCFGSRDSLQAVGDAVLSSRTPRSRSDATPTAAHTFTTADSQADEVVRQLDADDEDPLALFRVLQHAEAHDVCLRSPVAAAATVAGVAPSEEEAEAVQIIAAPPSTSAVVTYDAQTQFVRELAKRARLLVNHAETT